jgi:hypothetical protein
MLSFKTITVTSWDDIVKVVREARDILGATDDEECFFRGLSDMNFKLLPTLHRKAEELDWSNVQMLEKEGAFFWEFQARAHELHGLSFDDWDYLFAMRHHGVPTRLLDWTESLGVALYFAVKSDTATKRPCIWVLNPYSLNKKAGWGRDLVAPRYLGWDEREQTFYTYGDLLVEQLIDWKWPVAIYPMQRMARMRAQRGWFTMHGTDSRPIEEIAPQCVLRIDFDGQSEKETRDLLDLLGFDRFSMFTDLDSLADSVTLKNIEGTRKRLGLAVESRALARTRKSRQGTHADREERAEIRSRGGNRKRRRVKQSQSS